jgi:hypothetical protein
MAVGVRLLHDLVVHELLELFFGEAMHQLAGLVCRLEMLATLSYFVDVHLIVVSRRSCCKKCSNAYHRRVELVQVLPFGLIGSHHVDLGIFEWPAIPHLGHDILCIRTQRAVLSNKQSQAKTPLLAEDG